MYKITVFLKTYRYFFPFKDTVYELFTKYHDIWPLNPLPPSLTHHRWRRLVCCSGVRMVSPTNIQQFGTTRIGSRWQAFLGFVGWTLVLRQSTMGSMCRHLKRAIIATS